MHKALLVILSILLLHYPLNTKPHPGKKRTFAQSEQTDTNEHSSISFQSQATLPNHSSWPTIKSAPHIIPQQLQQLIAATQKIDVEDTATEALMAYVSEKKSIMRKLTKNPQLHKNIIQEFSQTDSAAVNFTE